MKEKIKKIKNADNSIYTRFSILLVIIVLFCTYIFPLGIIDSTYVISKEIFLFTIFISYLVYLKKLKWYDWILIFLVVILSILTKKVNFLTFLSLSIARIILEYKNAVLNFLKNSNFLYLCFFFTLLYSILYFGTDGRYAFTAIKEINQSGLAIFCLGILLLNKNKKIGLLTLIFGIFTFSRSYLLSIVILLLFKFKFIKKLFNSKIIKKMSYVNLIILSTILFLIMAYLFIRQFKSGNIGMNDKYYKFINIFDYSNLFRFTAILYTVMIFINYPSKIFLGLSETEYNQLSQNFANGYNIAFRPTDPHNLFFSHLKIYGIMSIIESIYISNILKKIVNTSNFSVYLSIVLYSLILGAGLYSYWLFLSIMTLVSYSDNKIKEVAL